MIAAILCPGPSLPQALIAAPMWVYGQKWTVNAAAKVYRADWISAGDKSWFRGLLGDCARPERGILCCPESKVDATGWQRGGAVLGWDVVPLIGEHARRGRPINWSLQAALCHAAACGAEHVDLFGCDLAGREDCTGYAGEDRTEDRWARERRDLDYTIALLAELGVTVKRMSQ